MENYYDTDIQGVTCYIRYIRYNSYIWCIRHIRYSWHNWYNQHIAQQQANARIRELETTLENAQLNYTRELEIMQERKDLEREKALVEVERTYQAKLQAQNDKYNDKVAEMHAENERIRQNYESRLEAFNNKDNQK